MALSPKEKDQIIEEETLRFETRQNLAAKACSGRHGRPNRWLWMIAFFLLGFAVHGWLHHTCFWGGERSCAFAGMGAGHHCMMGGMMPEGAEQGDDATAPKGPLSPDPAKK